jgi:hypothetical protein
MTKKRALMEKSLAAYSEAHNLNLGKITDSDELPGLIEAYELHQRIKNPEYILDLGGVS